MYNPFETYLGYETIQFEKCKIYTIKNFDFLVSYDPNKGKIVDKLIDESKISSAEELLFILDMNTDEFHRRQGYGSRALRKLVELAKNKGCRYLMGCAVTEEGRLFAKVLGFTDLGDDYYGLQL